MPFKNIKILLFIFFFSLSISAQDRKVLETTRINTPPSIDANLDDKAWEGVNVAKDFVMFQPGDGDAERNEQRSEVKVVYDDGAIYIGAKLHDSNPSEILKELGERDDMRKNTDVFFFIINPYNDGQQVFSFAVTAAGVQIDVKFDIEGNDDSKWNAVWESDVKIVDDGWIVEMRIPYSELRFPEKNVQEWGLNFLRSVKKLNEEYTWNYIDKSTGKFVQYNGLLTGISDIKPPTRLSFMPYVSGYVDNYDSKTLYNYNAGMDLKYGINESFTLDMTLIPDFGQAAYDEQVLNLGPFEVKFDENRQFFTEGTELFSKGNLFYSRRIGDVPTKFYDVQYGTDLDKYDIVENPVKTPLINATKVSGRTKGGLGIGFFNAITKQTIAEIKDKLTGEITEIETEPISNYNVFVLDQRFNGNSSVSLINTNVVRSGEFRDANVTGLLYDISNNSNSYKVFGEVKYSHVLPMPDSLKNGLQSMIGLEKTKGNFRFNHETRLTTEDYDNSDLGFMRFSNIWEIDSEVSYQTFEPQGNFNSYSVSFGVYHDRQFKPDHFIKVDLSLRGRATTLNFFSFGGYLRYSPLGKYDFYEPREDDRYLKIPSYFSGGTWISTDFRKKFAVETYIGYSHSAEWQKNSYSFNFSPRYRISDKLFIELNVNRELMFNDVGWVNTTANGDIIMGFRELRNLVSSLGSSYTFNNKMSVNLSFRHYWADIIYTDYMKLADNGDLIPTNYNDEHDITFNSWNIDLSYSWWFSPGSEISVLYRNSLLSNHTGAGLGYNENLNLMFDNPVQNNISIKLVYYIDFNGVKNIFKSKRN